MCGICGIYNFSRGSSNLKDQLKRMCQVMIHRGPDDEGYFLDDRIGLGMRRLAIIDLITGHQPIHNEDESIWVILNGEIYNFKELREELIKKGHKFYTNSDTETIVHLYEEEGENVVNKLNGMFAFAIWDKRNGILLLARDRLGIKPLHFFQKNNTFIFASEIKSILVTDYYKKEIDFDALSKYFSFEYIPAPQTIFKDIKKLLPGHLIVINNDKIKIKKYWDIKYEYEIKDENYYTEQIYERLREAVKKRLISDVPLGVFLSGGIDSSTVTYLMSQVSNSQIRTFSIGFEEQSFNELEYARIMAKYIGSEHKEFMVKSKMVKELVPILMKYLDEPLADASIIPTYIISKLAREFVTVALAGDGGDELFAGYDTYKAYQIARFYRKVPKFIRDHIIKNLVNILPASPKRLSFEFKAKKFISGIDYPPEISNYIWWGAYNPYEKDKLFSDEFKSLIEEDPYSPVFFHLKNYKPENILDRLGYLDIKLYLQDDLLVKVDRMSMANSLEIRVPFLDHNFVEFVTSIPYNLKLKGLKTKYILKKAMHFHLPKQVLYRKKIGFDIPLGVWIRKELKDFTLEVLSKDNLNRHRFFNYSYIEKILKEHFSGKHNHRQLLWPLIIFQFWYNHYIDGK